MPDFLKDVPSIDSLVDKSVDEQIETLRFVRLMRSLYAEYERDLEDLIGETMGVHRVDGVARHKRSKRTQWDKDALLRTVLDTRMADPATGEMLTQVDKVCHPTLGAFNLPAPRITVLRKIGLDPDEYCTVEQLPGWQIDLGA